MSKQLVMVALHSGYGDGYGVVRVKESGSVEVNPAHKVTHYVDGSKIEAWKAEILSQPSIDLVDRGVRVGPGAIKRIIGPLDGVEARRVRLRRYMKNGGYEAYAMIERVSDEDILALPFDRTEPELWEATGELWKKYGKTA